MLLYTHKYTALPAYSIGQQKLHFPPLLVFFFSLLFFLQTRLSRLSLNLGFQSIVTAVLVHFVITWPKRGQTDLFIFTSKLAPRHRSNPKRNRKKTPDENFPSKKEEEKMGVKSQSPVRRLTPTTDSPAPFFYIMPYNPMKSRHGSAQFFFSWTRNCETMRFNMFACWRSWSIWAIFSFSKQWNVTYKTHNKAAPMSILSDWTFTYKGDGKVAEIVSTQKRLACC